MSNHGRDGFLVCEIGTGAQVDFIACTKDGRMREKVERGLLLRIDDSRFFVADTRELEAS